jgi:LemA protein
MNHIIRRIFVLSFFLPFALSLSSCGYNSIVAKRETVDQSWSQVQNVYQRRADLIPNLVATVKGQANFESKTLTDVIEARAKATSIQVDAKDLTPENMKKFEDAQSGLSGALSRLMVVSENYPELKANAAFMALQGQLEGTENRITVERKKFNESVQDYNTTILTFPNNLTSGMFGFTKRAYFEAKAGAENTPEVKF